MSEQISTVPVLELRRRLGAILDKVVREHRRYIVEKTGIPVAVLMEIHEYEDLIETLEILMEQTDPAFQAQLRESEEEYLAGKVKTLSRLRRELGLTRGD